MPRMLPPSDPIDKESVPVVLSYAPAPRREVGRRRPRPAASAVRGRANLQTKKADVAALGSVVGGEPDFRGLVASVLAVVEREVEAESPPAA